MITRRLLPYGARARLLECADLADSQAMHDWLLDQHRPEIRAMVPGARTLLLHLDADLPSAFVRRLLEARPTPAQRPDAGSNRQHEVIMVQVRYDGEDLQATADLLRLTVQQLIDYHTGQDWTVAFGGFSPGFGYLAPTGPALSVPRRSSPRTRVPAGSVALADQWSAIYPTDSPGGWQLIGHTDLPLFDPEADPPATLRPGNLVRFVR
ncbi:5-oxoprolinase subunit B family protein [Microlunatus soli]|uniref:Sensor histidine kinase inhibitor, KipI family n=1 Tax=Microlunatus soli TaxID=630515 RepID=A0A1H1X6Z9_9ACTN|nr:allophanate hydrolase subunit 1 [Microlunatus soli]SDT05145.1 sensor histidine kinase inhibitor, KipI family [Microlunatus soli]